MSSDPGEERILAEFEKHRKAEEARLDNEADRLERGRREFLKHLHQEADSKADTSHPPPANVTRIHFSRWLVAVAALVMLSLFVGPKLLDSTIELEADQTRSDKTMLPNSLRYNPKDETLIYFDQDISLKGVLEPIPSASSPKVQAYEITVKGLSKLGTTLVFRGTNLFYRKTPGVTIRKANDVTMVEVIGELIENGDRTNSIAQVYEAKRR